VWLGAADQTGRMVSYIQSVYWEFGSGVVLDAVGGTWQNRGSSFSLESASHLALVPGRKPFHTLNPACARLTDGRSMVYGNMGGDGQPQSQAAIFTRYAMFGQDLQQAVTAPRWLLGRTWGQASVTLKIESRIDSEVINALARAGHAVEVLEPYSDLVGHAGALVLHPDGVIAGAADPRSDGAIAGF
jgi:gamma-glutamyltranspeptidase/glutathione hydrolase